MSETTPNQIDAKLCKLILAEELAKIEMESTYCRLSVAINKDQYDTGRFMGAAEFRAFAKAQPEYVAAAQAWAKAYAKRRGYEKSVDFSMHGNKRP